MTYEQALLEAVEAQPLISLEQSVWRVTINQRSPLEPNTKGGRWNPPDISALYTSLAEACAAKEIEHLLTMQGPRPRVTTQVHELRVKLQQVVDVSTFDRVAALGLDIRSLPDSLEGHIPCQAIGGAAAFLNYEGILVPSLRLSGNVNLVIFIANIQAGSFVDLSQA